MLFIIFLVAILCIVIGAFALNRGEDIGIVPGTFGVLVLIWVIVGFTNITGIEEGTMVEYTTGPNCTQLANLPATYVEDCPLCNKSKIKMHGKEHLVSSSCVKELAPEVVVVKNTEITKKPAVSKYETIQEYVQFKQFCEKYGKLFKQNFEVDVTENDELTCAGKNRKQLEYDIELIEQYKGVK